MTSSSISRPCSWDRSSRGHEWGSPGFRLAGLRLWVSRRPLRPENLPSAWACRDYRALACHPGISVIDYRSTRPHSRRSIASALKRELRQWDKVR